MVKLQDLTGLKVGRLTVLGLTEEKKESGGIWLCQCDCGERCKRRGYDLTKTKPVQSCGCLLRENIIKRNKATAKYNGDSMKPEFARLHRIWKAMQHRCYYETDRNYGIYGGRGISVCEEWHDWKTFKKWALENGYNDDLTIDRKDSNGNYEPSNCRWATMKEQANNKRDNKMIPYRGRIQTLMEWTEELGLPYDRTKKRINACGYTPEQAFELDKYPAQNFNHNKRLGTAI